MIAYNKLEPRIQESYSIFSQVKFSFTPLPHPPPPPPPLDLPKVRNNKGTAKHRENKDLCTLSETARDNLQLHVTQG